jgi:hypothetical protein
MSDAARRFWAAPRMAKPTSVYLKKARHDEPHREETEVAVANRRARDPHVPDRKHLGSKQRRRPPDLRSGRDEEPRDRDCSHCLRGWPLRAQSPHEDALDEHAEKRARQHGQG